MLDVCVLEEGLVGSRHFSDADNMMYDTFDYTLTDYKFLCNDGNTSLNGKHCKAHVSKL